MSETQARQRQREIGRLLRARREALGLSRADLAAQMGYAAGSIAVWESAGTRIGQHAVPLLASIIGVSVADLTNEHEDVARSAPSGPTEHAAIRRQQELARQSAETAGGEDE